MAEYIAAPIVTRVWRQGVPVVALVAAALAVITNPGTLAENMVALVAVVPFVLWALRPRAVPTVVLMLLVCLAQLIVLRSGDLESALFLVSLAAVVVGGWERSLRAMVAAGAIGALTPAVAELISQDGILVGVWVMGIVLPLLLSWASRWQMELTNQLAEARQAVAQQAVLEEKRRIARDVHDLVGHGLAAMLVHVSGAQHVLRRDLDEAEAALADAEEVGRRSLQELRRTLRLLRAPEGEPTASEPVPDAGDITAAVESAQASGIEAMYRQEGDLRRVDPVLGLSLHRVVEEALVNARRHAPDAVTEVVLAVKPSELVLTVESIGPLVAEDANEPDRPRYGLVGMQERMTTVGGELEAGPTATGWLVRCRAPLSLGNGGASPAGAP